MTTKSTGVPPKDWLDRRAATYIAQGVNPTVAYKWAERDWLGKPHR